MPSKPVKPSGRAKSPKTLKSKSVKPKPRATVRAVPKTKAASARHDTAGGGLEGRTAPPFVLPDQDGNPVSLESLRADGAVVLYFYPKDMTPGCTTEACSFRDNLDGIRALGATVVGVSADKVESHQKFIAKYALNFPLLSDTENKVTKTYGVYTKKSLYGREFMGIVRTTVIIGADGTVKKVFSPVKVNGHTEAVVAALKELG